MKSPLHGQKFIYSAKGRGRGDVHVVIQGLKTEVVTWTPIEAPDDPEVGGYSWMGTGMQFIRDFRKLDGGKIVMEE